MSAAPPFMTCTPRRYAHGKVQRIEEIISPEVACHFSYVCMDKRSSTEKKVCGSKVLYAYPFDVEPLVLGHTVLDILALTDEEVQIVSHVQKEERQKSEQKSSQGFEYASEQLPAYQAEQKNAYKVECGHEDEGKTKDEHWQVRVTLQRKKAQQIQQKYTPRMTYNAVLEIMDAMLGAPGLWDGTGCFHRAALFHPKHREMVVVEDIGRHNCVDRLYGHALLQGRIPEEYFLFLSSRITASLYKKIRRAGIKHMVSRAAITSTTYACALQEGCTVVAFCRPKEQRLTLFCGDGVY